MKLSFSTNAYTEHSVFYAVERIADIGYQGVELLAEIPHLTPFSLTDLDLQCLQSLLHHNCLAVTNINANTAMGYYESRFWEPLFEPSLANPDTDARKWRIDYTKKCIDFAARLGAPYVSVTSGSMLPGIEPEKSLEYLRTSLIGLVSYAQRYDIKIGIEYEPGLLISCCDELVSFLDDFDCPFLGANLDLGHSYVLFEDHEKVIEKLGLIVFHIHLEDIHDRKNYHLIPGLGDMDFQAILSTLSKHKYEGYLTVELYTYPHMPDEAAQRSLAYLQELLVASDKEKKLCA